MSTVNIVVMQYVIIRLHFYLFPDVAGLISIRMYTLWSVYHFSVRCVLVRMSY